MARRADHKREELYDMVLAAAARIVETAGDATLSARNVARAVGYSPGTLYNLFDNFDDLVVHLNGRTLDALFASLREVPLAGDPATDVAALCRRYVTFLDQNPNLCDLLFNSSYGPGYHPPDWYRQKIANGLEILSAALAPIFAGSARERVTDTARTLWASLHGICALSRNGKLDVIGAQSRDAMLKILIANFMTGLNTHNSEM